jgi:hypothetical protein
MGGSHAPKALAHGRRIAEAITALVGTLAEQQGARAAWAGTYGNALAGAVSAATLWWLDTRAIDRDELVEQLTTLIEGATDALLRSSGIIVDLTHPIPRPAPAG